MTASPQYESYKQSGIPWVQEIPAHWAIDRGKWLFVKAERPVGPEDDVVTAFRDGQVTLRANRRTEGFTNAIQEHGYQGIRKGDLVIHAMDAFAGAIGVSDSDGKATPVYSACIPRGEYYVNPYYYAYLLRYMSRSGYIQALAKGIRERSTDFRFNDFGGLFLPIPTRKEQDRIANFLDRRTAEIDEAIAKKKRLIELIKEQKAILIKQAVSKGLNLSVPMRESGVKWIGEVPAHWSVKPGRCVVSKKKELNVGLKETKVLSLSYGKIIVRAEEKLFGLVPESFETYQIVKEGDLVIRATDLQNDRTSLRVGLVKSKGIITAAYINLRPNRQLVEPAYLYLVLHSYDLLKVFYGLGSGLRQNLDYSDFKYMPLTLPPINEQARIIRYCQGLEADAQQVIDATETEVRLIKEYRDVLVAEAVRGKINI